MKWIYITWIISGLIWMMISKNAIQESAEEKANELLDERLHGLIPISTAIAVLIGMIMSPITFIKYGFRWVEYLIKKYLLKL